MAVEVSEPPQCCVTPMAQRMQTLSAWAISRECLEGTFRVTCRVG
jgi:hypothetical protein